MQGYTTFKINIPNDRIDLIENANNLLDKVRNAVKGMKKTKKKSHDEMTFEDLKKFSGIAPNGFENISVDEMRINKALRK